MPFDWLVSFQKEQEKPEDYAEKTLAAYRLGIKAGGSIYGVRIEVGQPACAAAVDLPDGVVYYPAEEGRAETGSSLPPAPHLPLPGCTHLRQCRCVYRPVMTYQVSGGLDNAGRTGAAQPAAHSNGSILAADEDAQ